MLQGHSIRSIQVKIITCSLAINAHIIAHSTNLRSLIHISNIITCRLELNDKAKVLCQTAQRTMDGLAQGQILRIIGVAKSIFCFNLFGRTITITTVQCNVVTITATNFTGCIYNGDFHGQRIMYRRNARICGSIFSNSIIILTDSFLVGTQDGSQLHSSSCRIFLIRPYKRISICRSKLSIRSCTINGSSSSLLYNCKAKVHAVRSSALYNSQRLCQLKIIITLSEHFSLRFIILIFGDANLIRCRCKRCGCANGEHHGGSQNAREEFLQFHCYSSLVRNSSYSCAAAQTPRFTGRMPAASSGFRGITDCVAAVV